MNDKIYVLIKADGDDVAVKVYKDKYKAAGYVMETCYGEDWEIQMEDEDWENAPYSKSDYEEILNGYGFTDGEGVLWSIEETVIED